MKLSEINPYVRFARNNERSFSGNKMVAPDHRIFCVIGGRVRISICGKVFDVEKGDIIYWHSGIDYNISAFEDAGVCGFNFDFTYANSHVSSPVAPCAASEGCKAFEDVSFEDVEMFNSYFVIKNAFSLTEKFSEIVDEYERRELYYSERCSAILKDILLCCARFSVTSHDSKSARIAREILHYIRINYKSDITNLTIAKHFNYHPNYLNSLIILHTGTSMHRYLLNFRINKAIELLQTTTWSVTKVAEEVGFSDMKHFSKLFKSTVGFPPGYYKKNNMKLEANSHIS